jgi:dephospho-CoA kinase
MDELGHAVEAPDGEAYLPILQEFGREILNQDLTIDRRHLGRLVFGNPDRLAKLNAIVHPAVRARAQQLENEFFAQDSDGIAVTEAAILIETGSYKIFDKLILAVCRPDQQVERAMTRDGLTREEALERLARQMPLEEKMKYADYIIDTSGSKERTVEQAEYTFQALRNLSRGVQKE